MKMGKFIKIQGKRVANANKPKVPEVKKFKRYFEHTDQVAGIWRIEPQNGSSTKMGHTRNPLESKPPRGASARNVDGGKKIFIKTRKPIGKPQFNTNSNFVNGGRPQQRGPWARSEMVVKPMRKTFVPRNRGKNPVVAAERGQAAANGHDSILLIKRKPKDTPRTKPVQNSGSPSKPEQDEVFARKPSTEQEKVKKEEREYVYDRDDINRTIFVGNLPPNTKESQLMKFISQFGPVKTIRFRTADGRKLIKHEIRREVESLNAYVVLQTEEALTKALEANGNEFKGRHVRITRASKPFESVDPKCVIFVGNLKYSATDEKLYDIFSSCGEIDYVRTMQSPKGCKGFAYVGFKKPESVGLALELKNTMLDERPIHVARYSKAIQEAAKQKEEQPTLKGAARRIDKKQKQSPGSTSPKGKKTIKETPKGTKKKSEFRGVKVNIKKKPKKLPSKMIKLAKKIAPRS